MKYAFTCPIDGCHMKMTAESVDEEQAAISLVADAKNHLAKVHPDIKKSDEEVGQDIRSHMVLDEQA